MMLDIEWDPSPRESRRWAYVTATLLAGAALLLQWIPPRGTRGSIALALAVVVWVAGMLGPRAIRPLHRAWMGFAWLMATAIGTATLAAVYFLVVSPIGIACRIAGRDRLQLTRPSGQTQWSTLDDRPDDPRRQF